MAEFIQGWVGALIVIAFGVYVIVSYGLPVGYWFKWTWVEVPSFFAWTGGGVLVVLGVLRLFGVKVYDFEYASTGRLVFVGWLVYMGIGVLLKHLEPSARRKVDYRQDEES